MRPALRHNRATLLLSPRLSPLPPSATAFSSAHHLSPLAGCTLVLLSSPTYYCPACAQPFSGCPCLQSLLRIPPTVLSPSSSNVVTYFIVVVDLSKALHLDFTFTSTFPSPTHQHYLRQIISLTSTLALHSYSVLTITVVTHCARLTKQRTPCVSPSMATAIPCNCQHQN